MDKWTNEQMDEWTNAQINEWIFETFEEISETSSMFQIV